MKAFLICFLSIIAISSAKLVPDKVVMDKLDVEIMTTSNQTITTNFLRSVKDIKRFYLMRPIPKFVNFKVTGKSLGVKYMKVYTSMLFDERFHVQGRVIGSDKYEQIYYLDVHADLDLDDKEIYGEKALGYKALVFTSFNRRTNWFETYYDAGHFIRLYNLKNTF